MVAGHGEAPLVRNEGFGDDPTDDKTNGRFEVLIERLYKAVLLTLGYVLPTSKTLTGSSSSKTHTETQVIVNQSGTAGFVAWLLNVTQTAVGSGTKLLMDLQVAAASKFKVSNTGDVTVAGELIASVAGKGLSVKEGSNARMGVSSAMTAGTITISTTAIATGDRVLLQHVTPGGTLGHLSYGTIVNATSFVITSSSNTDTSTVLWMIVKPAA